MKGNLGVCFLVGKERERCKGAVVCSAGLGMPLCWGVGATRRKNRQKVTGEAAGARNSKQGIMGRLWEEENIHKQKGAIFCCNRCNKCVCISVVGTG